jgi:hypothetical protein
MKIGIIKFLFIVSLLLLSHFIFGQTDFESERQPIQKIKVPKKRIEKYKNNPDFNYVIKKAEENILIKAINWIKRLIKSWLYRFFSWLMDAKAAAKWVQIVLKSLPYMAIIIFSYIIFRFLIGADLIRLKKRPAYPKNKVFAMNDEEIIKQDDFENLINDALNDKDYRLAVRYYYLQLLKQLIDRQLVTWHPDKTNHDYVNEIKNQFIKEQFKSLTFIYDYVWYGKHQLYKKDFDEIVSQFLNVSLT